MRSWAFVAATTASAEPSWLCRCAYNLPSYLPIHLDCLDLTNNLLIVMSAQDSDEAAIRSDEARPTTACMQINHKDGSTRSSANFLTLPTEIQLQILRLAVSDTSTDGGSGWRTSEASSNDVDDRTALCLLDVSRHFNTLVGSIVLKHLRIERPSILLAVYRAVIAQPSRGKMIQSLHLGQVESPGQDLLWPLRHTGPGLDGNPFHDPPGERRLHIFPAEHWPTERCKELFPYWISTGREISLDRPERRPCVGKAVYKGLVAAMEALDVDPYRKEYGKSGRRIGLVSMTSYP